jgi:hypothetical protein
VRARRIYVSFQAKKHFGVSHWKNYRYLVDRLQIDLQRRQRSPYYSWTNFGHKLRNAGQVFAPNHEVKKLCIEIALKQGWGKHTLGPKKNWAFE